MTVYEARDKMRELTKKGEYFSFMFMSYYRSKQSTSGIVHVAKAKLRSKDLVENNQNADLMIEYLDIDSNQAKEFYLCNLMELNGTKLEFADHGR